MKTRSTLKQLLEIIEGYKSGDIDKYIQILKSILLYIGKVTLTNLYDNKVNKNKLQYFNNIILKLEVKYNPDELIAKEDRLKIDNILKQLDDNSLRTLSLGEIYEASITSRERKLLGQVYTPKYIIDNMIESEIKPEDLISNPYFKVLDPACGGGYFLLAAYKRIKEIFQKHYLEIITNNPHSKEDLSKGLHTFILNNNLWGADIDDFAVFMTWLSLILQDHDEAGDDYINPNIKNIDILLSTKDYKSIEMENVLLNDSFDLVVGNPPYIGHKKIDKDYRTIIGKLYGDVYSDKSDISYCFFKKAHELLKDKGKLAFITSRYFLESPSATKLRGFINQKFFINVLIDFYGKKVFKGVGVSPVIIKCMKTESNKGKSHIYRLKNFKDKNIDIESSHFIKYDINQEALKDSGWVLITPEESNIWSKIDSLGNYTLNEICTCHQGIITGCDEAFIVNKDVIEQHNLERDIIRPWIKNSQIKKYRRLDTNKYIIYADSIEDISKYENTLSYLKPFYSRLIKRRECTKGIRNWYQLQWGRNIDIFKRKKIIFPFKSDKNQFTILHEAILSSADTYIITLKENGRENVPIEYILAYLNSSVFEFYFKSVAKKVGDRLYDYYPNKIMNLRIQVGDEVEKISESVNRIIEYNRLIVEYQEDSRNKNSLNKDNIDKTIQKEIKLIDDYFYKIYQLNKTEIANIEQWIDSV